jgi:hypothetical protein
MNFLILRSMSGDVAVVPVSSWIYETRVVRTVQSELEFTFFGELGAQTNRRVRHAGSQHPKSVLFSTWTMMILSCTWVPQRKTGRAWVWVQYIMLRIMVERHAVLQQSHIIVRDRGPSDASSILESWSWTCLFRDDTTNVLLNLSWPNYIQALS